ncbi:type IV pilus assembly protein FimV [Roseateles sp. NT4]|uniref:type IV pilus assembly protein FimV n=1 Tax=Roseateles sp. NT4 TaxID=3453715 RepID=UPI003F71A8ED
MALLLGLAPDAQALGVGRPQIYSTLGKPLDASIPVTLADGEQLTDACVRAEVSAGDVRVPAGLLQLHVEGEPGQQRIRLQSLARIDEPAVRITLALGCPVRLTREVNLFIDPPGGVAALPVPAPAPVAPAVAAPAPRPVAEASPAPAPRPVARQRPRAKPRASGPRLVLERPEVLVAEAPRPAKPAASAVETEMSPELEAQITQLEQTVAQLRVELEAKLQAEAAAASAAAADAIPRASAPVVAPPAVIQTAHASPYRDPMTWLFTLALSLLAGAVAFYGSRWRDERARRELAYWRALHAAEGAGLPPVAPPVSPGMAPPVVGLAASLPDEGQHQATRPQPRPMPWPPAPLAAPPVIAPPMDMQATQPMAPPLAAPSLSNEVTVADELLDLQQQVDFLQLLGQHEAAADLLATRLSRGNAGAMPYLMLMELCQQRGEPEVFAELVKQFEQRFRVAAPQWTQSLARGRSLDANPSVIAHLQVVWSDPGTAMQMLQDLLARGSGPGAPSFELPAYRDLLTLYSVSRDLFEAGLRGEEVDLMLPIDSSFGRA